MIYCRGGCGRMIGPFSIHDEARCVRKGNKNVSDKYVERIDTLRNKVEAKRRTSDQHSGLESDEFRSGSAGVSES